MSIKEKYPTSDWVISLKNLNDGDWVVYENEWGQEVTAQYLGIPEGAKPGIMLVQPENQEAADVVSIYETVTYKLRTNRSTKTCSCGARHTSNPKFHLKYCNIGE